MDKIFFVVFLLACVPYMGLPSVYDNSIVVFLVLALLYCLYLFVKQNDIRFNLSVREEDDFLPEDETGKK